VALDNVSRDFGGMTRSQIRRNTKPHSDDLKVSGLLDRDGKTRVLEMPHPARAATAIRTFVNKNGCSLGRSESRGTISAAATNQSALRRVRS